MIISYNIINFKQEEEEISCDLELLDVRRLHTPQYHRDIGISNINFCIYLYHYYDI